MSKSNPISIAIQLDSHLNLIARSFVNSVDRVEVGEGDNLVYHRDIDLSSGSIRLFTIFETVWEELLTSVSPESINQILFIIGPRAGFTDSRMVFLWLKTQVMMYPNTNLSILKNQPLEDLKKITSSQFDELFSRGGDNLQYSQEPRIGKN